MYALQRLPEEINRRISYTHGIYGNQIRGRINRFEKKRGSDFDSDDLNNTNHRAATLNGGSISKQKRSSDLTSRIKSN